ncbi:MAG: L-threonylcarbamoyladenylate synthase [Pseudomonadota bacterium]
MSQYFEIHPTHPQARLIRQAADIVRGGGVIAYPTDSTYAFGCHLGDKSALERIRALRRLDRRHLLTLVCHDLSVIATYAKVDNGQYRLLRRGTPGPYTFILEASRELPKRLLQERRKTIGMRVPDHPIPAALLAELDEPLLTTTALLPGDELPLTDGFDIRERLQKQLDLVIDGGPCGLEATTVVDLTLAPPAVLRQGIGAWPL